MSLILAKGTDVNLAGDVDLKTVYIRLKENEAVKVRVLGLTDYVEYKAHSDYNNKIYTQPCIAPTGCDCPLCTAGKSGLEQFKNLYPKRRYLFAFGDLATGKIRVWDCSYGQAKDMLSQIKEYADNINEVAFNFKRTGSKTETSYKLNPILKMKPAEVEQFEALEGVEVGVDFFESVLVPRTEKLMLDVLDDAGFPVTQYYPNYVREVEGEAKAEGAVNADTKEDGEMPF
jgi:hypothetical protein